MHARRQDLRRALQVVAFAQAGYFTASQAVDIGYSHQAQKYHVDAGNWERVDRGLFRLPGWPSTDNDVFVRWTLWSRGRGVISHESALAIHELSDVDPILVHMTVPSGFHPRNPALKLHQGTLADEDLVERGGWSVTTPLRTLLDVGGSTTPQETLDRAVHDALERGIVTRRSLLRASADAPDRTALRLERALVRSDDA